MADIGDGSGSIKDGTVHHRVSQELSGDVATPWHQTMPFFTLVDMLDHIAPDGKVAGVILCGGIGGEDGDSPFVDWLTGIE